MRSTELHKKLRELNEPRIKAMQLGEMINIIIQPQTWDETFVQQVKEKYLEISKN